MATQPLEQRTYMPEPANEVAPVLSFIKKHEEVRGAKPERRYFLAGPDEHDQVEIPPQAFRVLLQVLEAMKAGKAVTVAPTSKLLTTQEAADLLGVSRPTVTKLIDEGKLPAEVPGRRRRLIKLDDLLKYRAERREAQYRALLETSVDYAEEPKDAESEEAQFRRVRAEVAARRRARAANVQQ